MLAHVVAAAAQRAGGARGDEEVVEPALECLVDLAHRAGGVRGRVGLVGVLIRPERVGDLGEQIPDQREARDEQVAGLAIRLRDDAHVGAQRAHRPHVRVVRSRVDHADQPHAVVAAGLGESDAGVAGGGLDDGRAEIDEAVVEGVLQHARGGPVLGTAAGVGRFQLRPESDVGAQEVAMERDQRRVADRAEDAVDGLAPAQGAPEIRRGAHVSSQALGAGARRVLRRRRAGCCAGARRSCATTRGRGRCRRRSGPDRGPCSSTSRPAPGR